MKAEPTVNQIIEGMPSRFDPEAAGNLTAVLQFRLTGEEAAAFFAEISQGVCELTIGKHPSPTLTLEMSAKTYKDMVMGRITGQQAFFTRKLKFKGPIDLAVKLHRLFRPPILD